MLYNPHFLQQHLLQVLVADRIVSSDGGFALPSVRAQSRCSALAVAARLRHAALTCPGGPVPGGTGRAQGFAAAAAGGKFSVLPALMLCFPPKSLVLVVHSEHRFTPPAPGCDGLNPSLSSAQL